MAQKTVLRRLLGTYGILSTEMQTALAQDEKPAPAPKAPAPVDVDFSIVDKETGEVLDPAPQLEPIGEKAPF